MDTNPFREDRLLHLSFDIPEAQSNPPEPETESEKPERTVTNRDGPKRIDADERRQRKADRELAERREQERENPDRKLEESLSSRESSGYISDEAMNLMAEWGLLQPPLNGTGTIEQWIQKAGFETDRGRVEFNVIARRDSLYVELVGQDGSAKGFQVNQDGTVELVEEYRLVSLGSLLKQEFHGRDIWVGELKIREENHQLVGLLKDADGRGIILKKIPTSGNVIGLYRDRQLLAQASSIYLKSDWERRLGNALREALDHLTEARAKSE